MWLVSTRNCPILLLALFFTQVYCQATIVDLVEASALLEKIPLPDESKYKQCLGALHVTSTFVKSILNFYKFDNTDLKSSFKFTTHSNFQCNRVTLKQTTMLNSYLKRLMYGQYYRTISVNYWSVLAVSFLGGGVSEWLAQLTLKQWIACQAWGQIPQRPRLQFPWARNLTLIAQYLFFLGKNQTCFNDDLTKLD